MIKMMNRISSTAMLAVAFMLCATSAWAVTANFVWDSDFGTATKTGLDGKTYTLSLPDDSWLQENGTLKAGSGTKGAHISLKHNDVYNLTQGTKLSVLMEYENASAQSSAVPLYLQADSYFGLKTNGSSLDIVGDAWGTTYSPVTTPTMTASGYLLMVYPQNIGVLKAYAASTQSGLSDASAGGDITSLKYSDKYLQNIVLGGPLSGTPSSTLNNFANLVVKRVAVFTSAISASDAAAYDFPDYIATVTSADTSWASAFPTWDDEADNTGKTVYLEIKEGASVSRADALSVKNLIVTGKGSLTLSGVVTATGGITIGAGVSVTISGGTSSTVTNYGTLTIDTTNVSGAISNNGTVNADGITISGAITNNGTFNVDGCTFSGAVTCEGTMNTTGTVSFSSSVNNTFKYGSTLNINGGTTTYNSSSDRQLKGALYVKKGATLVNAKHDSLNYDAGSSAPVHVYLYGTLTMTDNWTIGKGYNTIHLYDGALINGTVNNALHFNTGVGNVIAEEGDSVITAPFVKGGGTISVNVNAGATLSTVSTPTIATKTGDGKLLKRVENARWGGGAAPTNYDGVERYSSTSGNGGNGNTETFLNSNFSGVLKVTTEDDGYMAFAWVGVGSFTTPVFSDRPTLWANGDIRIYHSTVARPFTVKNLSGSGYIKNFNTYDSSDLKYVDTLQTEDTTYSGSFVNSTTTSTSHPPALTVRGGSELHSLTLTGVSDTTGPLTIENNAKVVFSSTGKWSGGTVNVKNGGVLESQNSAAIAATLKVAEGATLKFANGVQLLADGYDWTSVSNDESVKNDLSDVTPSATPVTLIASGVTLASSKFTVSATQRTATLLVEDGALKANFANFWRDGEWCGAIAANDAATLYISQNSTLTVSEALSLGAVTVVNESEGNVTLTIAGAGKLSANGLTVSDGVTLDISGDMTVSGTVSGSGTINVPNGGKLTMDGATCSTKITVQSGGTLDTDGTTVLSSTENTFATGCYLNIGGTKTSLTAAKEKLSGTITIAANAELENVRVDDAMDFSSTSQVDVYGTLNMANTRWTLKTVNTINLYAGGEIKGNGQSSYGALDAADAITINVKGTSTISAKLRTRQNLTLNVESGTLTYTGSTSNEYTGNQLIKTGAGTIESSATPICIWTVNEGKVVQTVFPSYGVTIAEGATFTLKNVAWTATPGRFSGAGTLELYNDTGAHLRHTVENMTFGGKLKITAPSDDSQDGDTVYGHVIDSASASFIADGTTPQLEIATSGNGDNNSLYLGTAFDAADTALIVADLTGSGKISPFVDATTGRNHYIEATQTKDTEFAGIFEGDFTRKTHLSVTGSGAVRTLTLSGVNTTYGGLTVGSNAKVVFASTGSWANGAVTVENGGVLESMKSGTIAASLAVKKGATLKFADGVALAATAYDWSDVAGELENSERIKVDLSDVTPASEVTLIASGVTIDVSKFTVTSAKYGVLPTLSVVNNALKATYPDNLCVDGTWLTGPTANQPANLLLTTTSATLTTATDLTLGAITIYNMSGASATVTTAGAGVLALGGLSFPYAGVMLNVSSDVAVSGSVMGTAAINVSNGGELTIDGATCATTITVQDGGKLYTKGTTTLSSSANVFYYGSEFEVVGGTTTLTTASAGLKGLVTIDDDGTLTLASGGGLNSSATALEPTELHVYGTLNMSTYNWSLQTNNALYLYTGCTVSGDGPDVFGPLDLYGGTIYVKPNGETYGTVSFSMKVSCHTVIPVDVAENMRFEMTSYLQLGFNDDLVGFTKTGLGEFALSPSGRNNNIKYTTTTVSAGRMIMTSMPMFPSVVIEDGATFTLKDTEWTSGNVFSGTGILELYSATGNKTHTITGSTFGGVIKLSNVPVAGSNPPKWQNNINQSGSAMFDSSVRPEFVCDSTATHLGSGYYKSDSTKIEVRNLSGAGSLRAQWTSSSDCHYTIETKQTKATAFTGTIAAEDGDTKTGGGKYTRYINLSVIGDDSETPNSLTITQGQNTSSSDSSQALSTLTVSDNAKVIFGENGGWGYGHVIVGDDGYLECTNNAAVKKLTLNDGATLVFPTSSSCLSEITSITFSSGTVTVSYPSGVTPTSGTKLINWSSAPAGSFVFDNNGSTVKQFGGVSGDYYMLESESTGLYIRKAVAVDNLASQTPKFYSSVEGALDENDAVYLIAAPDEHVTLPFGKTIWNTMGVGTSNLTVSPTTAEYAVQHVSNSYTVASTAVTYYWAGTPGGDWGTRSNWKVAAADGPYATRDMETTDSVAFTDSAIVALGAKRTVAGIAVEDTVYISAVDAATKSLETTGNITGTGALTLADVTLANVATATLTVAPAVNFTSDSELAATGGYGFTFNGAVSISNTIKVWNVNHTVAGTTTLNGNFTKEGGFGLILGDVTVSANTTPTISNGSITINGAVTVSAGATFTIPASGLTVGDSASFVLGGKSSVLVDNGSGASGKVSTSLTDGAKVISSTTAGVTTYKVVYGTIFSVY